MASRVGRLNLLLGGCFGSDSDADADADGLDIAFVPMCQQKGVPCSAAERQFSKRHTFQGSPCLAQCERKERLSMRGFMRSVCY